MVFFEIRFLEIGTSVCLICREYLSLGDEFKFKLISTSSSWSTPYSLLGDEIISVTILIFQQPAKMHSTPRVHEQEERREGGEKKGANYICIKTPGIEETMGGDGNNELALAHSLALALSLTRPHHSLAHSLTHSPSHSLALVPRALNPSSYPHHKQKVYSTPPLHFLFLFAAAQLPLLLFSPLPLYFDSMDGKHKVPPNRKYAPSSFHLLLYA